MGSGIGIVLVVLGRRILNGKPGVLPARHRSFSQSLIVHERTTAALLLSLERSTHVSPTCSIGKPNKGYKSVPALLNLASKWHRRQHDPAREITMSFESIGPDLEPTRGAEWRAKTRSILRRYLVSKIVFDISKLDGMPPTL